MVVSARVPRFARRDALLAVGCAVVSLIIYLLTLAPELPSSSWAMDSGDLISAAFQGRLAHPPGTPLHWLLTRLFIKIPFGNPAWRLNLFSAICASSTVGILVQAIKVQGFNKWIAAISGLSVALSQLFWSHAIITEVYALAALCVSVWLLIQALGKKHSQEFAFWSGLVTGLAASVHLTTLVICVPGWPKQNRDRVLFVFGLFLGMSPYLVFLLVRPCTQIWGNVCTLNGWWIYVSAQMYGGYSFALPRTQWFSRFWALLSMYSRMFSPLGTLVILYGVGELFLSRNSEPKTNVQRTRIARYLVALVSVSLYAFFYNTGDSIVYLVPMLPVCGYILAVSLTDIPLSKVPVYAYTVIPVLLLILNWSTVSLAGDDLIARQQEHLLAQLPEQALLLTRHGDYTFDLWYSVEVQGRRRDVLIVDTALWQYAPYRAYMRTNYTDVPSSNDPGVSTRPVCIINMDEALCD